MTKKLTLQMVLAGIMALCLNSCRSEDLLNETEKPTLSKFRVFTATEEGSINYGKGFKTLLEHYDEIHNVQHTAKALRNAFKNSSKMADEYAELNIRSQDFTTRVNEKFTLFPLIKNQKVDGIIIAILKENDTQVEFLKMYPEVENYNKILELFKEAYLKNILQQRIAAKGNGNCSSDGSPCDTGEVVITMPGVTIGGGSLPSGGGWVPPEGCQPYDNCLHPGGGGNDNPPLPGLDPCQKLRKQRSTPDFRAKINLLETNLDMKRETGYVEKRDGTYEYKDAASTHVDSNSLSLGNPTSDMKGFLHTHVNDFEDSDGNMRLGFKIFSPADVIYFNEMVALAKANGLPLDDTYAVMVSGSGNYQIRFTGTADQIKTQYLNTKEQYNAMYIKYFQANSKNSNEVNFLKFIDEQMNVRGVTLIKLNDDGSTMKKNLNDSKTDVVDTPCITLLN